MTDPNMPLLQYFDRMYVQSKLETGASGSRVWRVRSAIESFEKMLGRSPLLRDLDDFTLSAFIDGSLKARKPGGVRWTVELLMQIWRFAIRRGDLPRQSGKPKVSQMSALRNRKKDRPPAPKKPALAPASNPLDGPKMLLRNFVVLYSRTRDLAPRSLEQYTNVASLFSRSLRRPARISDLNPETLNAFIAEQLERVARISVHTYRRALLVLWRDAFDRELTKVFPRRIRTIKLPARIIDGYDVEQLEKLLRAAAALDGIWWKTMIERRAWWTAFLLTAWNTGLRLGDLLAIKRESIIVQTDGSGRLSVVMSKTGQIINRIIPPANVEAIDRCMASGFSRKLCFPMGDTKNALMSEFRCIASLAGLKGTLRWLRRGSASEVERVRPGAGKLHLGHKTPGLFEKAYKVDRIVRDEVILPPQPAAFAGKGVEA